MIPRFEWGEQLPRLAGRRVELRWLLPDDAPAMLEIFGDPEVMRYWSSPPLEDLSDAHELITEFHQFFAARRLFQWGICEAGVAEVVGTCTLWNVDRSHRRAEVGFALGRRSWGRGLAREALEVLFGFAFEVLGLHRLEADVDPENVRSLRLLERLGFQREGYLRERWHHLGGVHDAVFLGMLRREWEAVAAGSR